MGVSETTDTERPSKGLRRLVVIVGLVAVETLAMRLRGYRIGRNVIVRCQRGHFFTTTWIPGGSLKSLRLLWWRYQRCPVGGHWSIVTPVRESDLSRWQRHRARATRDAGIP